MYGIIIHERCIAAVMLYGIVRMACIHTTNAASAVISSPPTERLPQTLKHLT
jgi:hypothetical protein